MIVMKHNCPVNANTWHIQGDIGALVYISASKQEGVVRLITWPCCGVDMDLYLMKNIPV